jgi:hypothetical protein
MNKKLLLNKKTHRENDHNQYEIDIKKSNKDFGGVKSVNDTSKNKNSENLKNNKKLFVINNNKIDKKKELIEKNIDKKIEIKNEKNSLLENGNSYKNEKEKQNYDPNTIIQKGFHNFKINNLWDLFFKHICLLVKKEKIIEKEFLEHYSFYINNNFKALKLEKGFKKIENLLTKNELLMKESNHFFQEREKEIKKSLEKYESNQTGNIENKIILSEINNNNDNCLSENNKFEIIAAAVIQCLLEKEENELKKNEEENNQEYKNNKKIQILTFQILV